MSSWSRRFRRSSRTATFREYATKLFENGGRGIGEKGKNNGVLILLALKQRKVWIEVGYGLEEWITDWFSGETSRQYMVPEFRTGAYGTGLLVGTARVVGRIAKGKNLKLDVQVPQDDEPEGRSIFVSALAADCHLYRHPRHQPHRRRARRGHAAVGSRAVEPMVERRRYRLAAGAAEVLAVADSVEASEDLAAAAVAVAAVVQAGRLRI